MHVRNIHQRSLRASPREAAFLLDGLSSAEDPLWPSESWPRMRLDRPLGPGAAGGHGPIRYTVAAYEPGRKISFRFTAPRGFDGAHWFEVSPEGETGTLLRHTIEMNIAGPALVTWPLVFRPLHDALVEDALAKAQAALGEDPTRVPWSAWVRLLRRALRR
ncbi:MAG: SRPBCC family protein [Betaproteobacteria bacterium]|nr:SRPBCC family protein [Betaproteobacteria bacterium]